MNCRHHPVCRSRSCAELGHNNNLNPVGKPARPPSIELAFPCIEEDVSPIRPPAGVCALEEMVSLVEVKDGLPSDVEDQEDERKSAVPRRPTSIMIGAEPRRAYSPPLTSSPIGNTLKADLVDLELAPQRAAQHSESFQLAGPGLEEDGTGEVLDIRVFFSNGKAVQFPVENGQEARAADILELMADHLGIDEEVAGEALALWLVSPFLEVQLKPYHVAFAVRRKWPLFLRRFTTAAEEQLMFDEPLLVLRRNVHLPIHLEVMYDDEYERLTEVLYLDAKDEYVSGRYLVDLETSARLAALQMAIEYTLYEREEDAEDLLKEKMADLVPAHLLHRARSFHLFGLSLMECKRGCERQILDEYRRVSEEMPSNHERRKAFLNILRKTPFYGAAFFYGTADKKPSSALRRFLHGTAGGQLQLRIGVSHDLVTVVDEQREELLLTRRILDCSWFRTQEANEDEDIPSFFLHFPDDVEQGGEPSAEPGAQNKQPASDWAAEESAPVSRLLQVFTKQVPLIDALMNVAYERGVSEFGSDEDVGRAGSPASNANGDDMLTPASSTNSPGRRYCNSTKSSSSSHASLAKSTLSSSSAVSFTSAKLSKLCLATLDPHGRFLEAHGTLRRILQDCN